MVTSADALLATESGDGDPAPESVAHPSVAQERAELAALWRLLRRLGVSDVDVDDATQQVLLIAAERHSSIVPERRRSFLYGTALRVARAATRRNQRATELDEETLSDIELPDAEELVDRHRARAVLDELLARMPFDLRAVFVLFEIEDLSTKEIASVLNLPKGTVASRLRRAREDFTARVSRLEATRARHGGAR
jgi:RNA polymerase sigma-70 factor (ECF subfamily)